MLYVEATDAGTATLCYSYQGTGDAEDFGCSVLLTLTAYSVNICFDNDSAWGGFPRHSSEQNKKWVVASLSEDYETSPAWSAVLSVEFNAPAQIIYQRGNGSESIVSWQVQQESIQFENGELNYKIKLIDGSCNSPTVVESSDHILFISGVQQGDFLFIKEAESYCINLNSNASWFYIADRISMFINYYKDEACPAYKAISGQPDVKANAKQFLESVYEGIPFLEMKRSEYGNYFVSPPHN